MRTNESFGRNSGTFIHLVSSSLKCQPHLRPIGPSLLHFKNELNCAAETVCQRAVNQSIRVFMKFLSLSAIVIGFMSSSSFAADLALRCDPIETPTYTNDRWSITILNNRAAFFRVGKENTASFLTVFNRNRTLFIALFVDGSRHSIKLATF